MTSTNNDGTGGELPHFVALLGSRIQEASQRDGWESMTPGEVLDLIREEADTLARMMTEGYLHKVRREAADMATFCTMLADAAVAGLGLTERTNVQAS